MNIPLPRWDSGADLDPDLLPAQPKQAAFGRYRLVAKVAQGGMAAIYVAVHEGIQGFSQVVIIKRVLPHLATTHVFREMFLDEARIAAQLHHPNIVSTHELGEVDGHYFIAMEYLPGHDVLSILRRCRAKRTVVPIPIACAIAQRCAAGLHHAHDFRGSEGEPLNLVHRDISPSNIVVTYHGEVKILDFGIAKAAIQSANTQLGTFKGKLAHSAPEQLLDQPIDRRTDVFALGILLWELLANRPLFKRNGDAHTIDAVRTADAQPPSSRRPEIPKYLDDIIMRALSLKPSDRFASAEEMQLALQFYFDEHGSRPDADDMSRWLTRLFGEECANVKSAISEGRELEKSVQRSIQLTKELCARPQSSTRAGSVSSEISLAGSSVGSLSFSRPVWSTGDAGGQSIVPRVASQVDTPTGPGLAAPVSGTLLGVELPYLAEPLADPGIEALTVPKGKGLLIAGVIGVLLLGGGLLTMMGGPSPQVAATSLQFSTVELKSDPPGARVFVNGQPKGVRTPTELQDIPRGATVQVRLDKRGFLAHTEALEVTGARHAVIIKLTPATGRVQLQGLAVGVSVYVDEELVSAEGPLELSVGVHSLRVETKDAIIRAQDIDVAPGDQVLSLDGTAP